MTDTPFPVERTILRESMRDFLTLLGIEDVPDGEGPVHGWVFTWSLDPAETEPTQETYRSGRYIWGRCDHDVVHGPVVVVDDEGTLHVVSGRAGFIELARELAHKREGDYDLG